MELGTFSMSLAVKDIAASKAFYEKLGFSAMSGCGSVQEKWLMMKQGSTMLGLFEGMFEGNILTFNPADVRAIQQHLIEQGITPTKPAEGDTGPAHIMLTDPDGNAIMLDQF